jgi:DNA-binding MltR family transcriptional regulator
MNITEISRSCSGKLQIQQYEPITFFSSYKAELEHGDEVEECSERLFDMAILDVKQQMIKVKKRKAELLANKQEKESVQDQIAQSKSKLK